LEAPPHELDGSDRLTPAQRRLPGLVVVALFFASGAAGLVYQFSGCANSRHLRRDRYATSAVLSTFMGGLALGASWTGRRADRWHVPPLQTYGKLELGITAYAATVPWLLDRAALLLELAWKLGADRHFVVLGIVKFIAIAILILPATTMMGATLPVLSRIAGGASRSAGARVGVLYAMNTLGAVVGTIVAAFVALPALGMKRTLVVNLALNAFVGIVAWTVGRWAAGPPVRPSESADPPAPSQSASRTLVLAFAASGCAAMVLEVAWTRGLALVLGSSVYAYASMLTAFLLSCDRSAARRTLKRRLGFAAAVFASAGLLAAAHAIQFRGCLPRSTFARARHPRVAPSWGSPCRMFRRPTRSAGCSRSSSTLWGRMPRVASSGADLRRARSGPSSGRFGGIP
jgi:spermidine synthase